MAGRDIPFPHAIFFFWGGDLGVTWCVRNSSHTFFNFQGNFSRVRLHLRASVGIQSCNWFGCR